jgi:hypothetical protein
MPTPAARAAGHTGRLVGVDPDPAALDVARRCDDVEWVAGTAASMRFAAEFELATMTVHAFPCLVADAEARAARFAFETRHPRARAWEQWAAAPPKTSSTPPDAHS